MYHYVNGFYSFEPDAMCYANFQINQFKAEWIQCHSCHAAVLVYYLFVALKRCFHRRRAHVSPHRLINHCVILPFSVF